MVVRPTETFHLERKGVLILDENKNVLEKKTVISQRSWRGGMYITSVVRPGRPGTEMKVNLADCIPDWSVNLSDLNFHFTAVEHSKSSQK